MANTYAEMSRLSKEDLIALYDQEAQSTQVGLEFIKQEIWRRDTDRLNRNMERMTNRIQRLTIIITILTVVNVAAVLIEVLVERLPIECCLRCC